MGFLERFFSPDGLHFVVLSACLVYLIKTERRIARVEAIIELRFKRSAPKPKKESG